MNKHPLLKNEIETLQLILSGRVFPREAYCIKLINKLDDLKKRDYKVKEAGE